MYSKTKLERVLELHRGYDLPERERKEGNVPIISSSGYSGLHNDCKCDGENVITGRYGTIGEVFYHEGKCWPLNTALYVSDFKENNPKYVYYLLKYILKMSIDGKDKSTVPGVDRNVLHQMEIPFCQDIKEQKELIRILEKLDERIDLNRKINDNLEATAQAYFDSLFFDESEPNCTLADIALVNPVRPLAKGVEARYFEMATLPTNGCIPTGDFIKPYNGGVRFINGDTLIARITPCLENGKAAYINILEDNEVAFGSTEYIVFASKGNMPSSFYYFLIRNAKFVTFALQFMNGSSGRQRVSGEELASFPLCRPSCENLEAFDKVASLVLEQMKDNTYEIQKLKQLQEVIAATISSC